MVVFHKSRGYGIFVDWGHVSGVLGGLKLKLVLLINCILNILLFFN